MSAGLLGDPSLHEADRAAGSGGRRAVRWGAAAVGVAVALGVALRTHSPSPLWLDEAISASISGLPLREVPEALRRDGAPPLYPLLLWGWERVVGDSATQVRWLSALLGVAALPAAAVAGARLAGRAGAVAALLLFATSPFAIYYSSEARMYSLVMLLVLCGFLALDGYLRRPGAARGVLVAVVSAALALTHYWSLLLLTVVGGGLLAFAWRTRSRAPARAAGWMVAGGVFFLPWLPSFLYQFTHTGTPWASPMGWFAALQWMVVVWGGGGGRTTTLVLVTVLLLLAGIGATAVSASGSRVVLDLRGRPPGRALAVVVGATLVLALAVRRFTGAAFDARYTSVVLPLFLLLVAVGLARLPRAIGTPVLAVAVVTGFGSAVPDVYFEYKTQAGLVADALRAQALPGDVVVYCPDQLGPATSRLLPGSLRQEVYPTGGSPERVDWVDYAERNSGADPAAYGRDLSARAGGSAVWLVFHTHYRTYEGQCEALAATLTALRGDPLRLVEPDGVYFESAHLVGWAPLPPPGP
ncbi:glycosyltransferase family 39 protein [Geodermatophilus chilensis]|uniref:glycosyltransferase family 39 protein n=1 Tax=Geodermatophilus chilensis TaxID=2035835 RepID=UPI0018E4D79C|nr:glycosyltransferase family 39 protein [Geodermatophilus chilensis]